VGSLKGSRSFKAKPGFATRSEAIMPDNDEPAHARAILMKGTHVGLTLMRADDVPTIARWNQDLAFTARIGTPGEAHTIEMREDFYKQNSRVRGDGAEFSVVELGSERLVGFGGLFDISRALVANMFVGIGEPDARGKGFGSEACRLLCEYGFFFRNLHSIKVEVHAYNHTAIRVYERLGFKLVGCLRGANLLNGRRYDEVIMDLLREELEPRYSLSFSGLESTGPAD
jgi:RimJ/RimL family protein N-acetyltransferase